MTKNHPAVRPVVTARALEAFKDNLTAKQRTMDRRANDGAVSISYHAGYTAHYYIVVEIIDIILKESRERAARVAGQLKYNVTEEQTGP